MIVHFDAESLKERLQSSVDPTKVKEDRYNGVNGKFRKGCYHDIAEGVFELFQVDPEFIDRFYEGFQDESLATQTKQYLQRTGEEGALALTQLIHESSEEQIAQYLGMISQYPPSAQQQIVQMFREGDTDEITELVDHFSSSVELYQTERGLSDLETLKSIIEQEKGVTNGLLGLATNYPEGIRDEVLNELDRGIYQRGTSSELDFLNREVLKAYRQIEDGSDEIPGVMQTMLDVTFSELDWDTKKNCIAAIAANPKKVKAAFDELIDEETPDYVVDEVAQAFIAISPQ